MSEWKPLVGRRWTWVLRINHEFDDLIDALLRDLYGVEWLRRLRFLARTQKRGASIRAKQSRDKSGSQYKCFAFAVSHAVGGSPRRLSPGS